MFSQDAQPAISHDKKGTACMTQFGNHREGAVSTVVVHSSYSAIIVLSSSVSFASDSSVPWFRIWVMTSSRRR
jgi:hypothetical protein